MMDSVRDDTALTQMLAALTTLIEQHSPSMRCSILLLDADGLTLRHGAAPTPAGILRRDRRPEHRPESRVVWNGGVSSSHDGRIGHRA